MSQAVFARFLNFSTKLVQAWEAGRLTPDGVAAHHRIVVCAPANSTSTGAFNADRSAPYCPAGLEKDARDAAVSTLEDELGLEIDVRLLTVPVTRVR